MVRDTPSPGPRVGASPGVKKRGPRAKSLRRMGPSLSPFQERLKETDFYTTPLIDKFDTMSSVKDRLLLINESLSEDTTDITRAWPLQLKTKDSRLRRELSEKGKECFMKGQYDKVLEYYNKALMYSTGKGISHTLARRAAFFLSQGDHSLAVRDLNIALEYGGLDTEELLDFLLTHHQEDEVAERAKTEASIDSAINAIKDAKLLDMSNASAQDISKWADEIRDNLNKASKLRKNDPKSKKMKDDITKQIIASIKQASKETNLDENLEIEELQVPVLTEKNPLCPAFSEAAAIGFDPDKGRIVKARRDIKAGEIICVDEPSVSMLCPDIKENIKSHCLHCFRATKAPLPCDNCCTVVFCSRKCKSEANDSYHKIECQMKLYEMFEHEGTEVFKLFMGLRAITQKPVQYFTDNQKEIEKFLELEDPVFPFPGRAYVSSDYRALANLMTHVTDIDPDVAVKNAVLSVFFLRFLKKAGYFRSANLKIEKNQSISSFETFILRLIHQVICASTYNSHQVHKLSKTLQLERIGTSVNPSLSLVNHSCDSNSIRCNVNKSSILVAVNHIPMGQEITESYSVHFRNVSKNDRAYHTLKNYMFECECPACKESWPLEDDIPDEIFRIPTFDQEVIYKVRHGDKKDIVKDIILMRREVEKSMTFNRFQEALVNYQSLGEQLEEHLRHPHAFFLQVRSGITHCIWNLFCTQFPQKEIIEAEVDTGSLINAARENAKQIYNNDFKEKAEDNDTALDLGDNNDIPNDNPNDEVNSEKKQLYDQTKQLLEQSSQKFNDIKERQEEIEKEKLDALEAANTINPAENTGINGGNGAANITNGDSVVSSQTQVPKVEALLELTDEEKEIKKKQQEYEQELRNQQQKMKDLKKKQWAEEDKQRKEREEARKLKRAQETEEKIQKEREREKLKKQMKRAEEEEKIKQREIEFEKRKREEADLKRRQEEERLRKKKQEEEELELLLLEIGDDTDIIANEEETQPVPNELTNSETTDLLSKEFNAAPIESEDIPDIAKDITFKNMPINNLRNNDKPSEEAVDEQTNVWSSIRKIKESSSNYEALFNTKTAGQTETEMVSIDDIDDMIKQLTLQISEKRVKPIESDSVAKNECLEEIREEPEEEQLSKLDPCSNDEDQTKPNTIINNCEMNTLKKPFDYDKWRKDMDKMFGLQTEETVKKTASDEMYLQGLKSKIQENVKKTKKNFKNQEPPVDLLQNLSKKTEESKPTPKGNNEMFQLKMKEKERKRKKQEAVYQQKIETSFDKVKDMSLKSQKLEKTSAESEMEILKIREMAKKLVARSQANEDDFNTIFKDIENADCLSMESDNKKKRKGKKKEPEIAKSMLENDVHWTEEENNKWSSEKKEVTRVSNLLSALRQAAAAGASDFVTSSIHNAIDSCKKMKEEHEKERQADKEERLELEKIQKEEEEKIKLKKAAEENKRKLLEKERQEEIAKKKMLEELEKQKVTEAKMKEKNLKQKEAEEQRLKQVKIEKNLAKEKEELEINKRNELLKKAEEEKKRKKLEKEKQEQERKKKLEELEAKKKEDAKKFKEAEDRKHHELELEMKQAKEREEAEKLRIKEDEVRKQKDFFSKQNEEEMKRKEVMLKENKKQEALEERGEAEKIRLKEEEVNRKEEQVKEKQEALEEREQQNEVIKALGLPQNENLIATTNSGKVEEEMNLEMEANIKHEEQMKRQEEFLLKMQQNEKNKKQAFLDKIGAEQKAAENEKKLRKDILEKKELKTKAFNKKEEKQNVTSEKVKGRSLIKPAEKDHLDSELSNLDKIRKDVEAYNTKSSSYGFKQPIEATKDEEDKKLNPSSPLLEDSAIHKSLMQDQLKSIRAMRDENPKPSVKKDWPTTLTTVKTNSFIPKVRNNNEIEIMKIGSPSQIRKAVRSNVKMDLPEPSSNLVTVKPDSGISMRDHKNQKEKIDTRCSSQIQGEETFKAEEKEPVDINYKIRKVPTTTFEFKFPKKLSTTNVDQTATKETKSTASVENVVKYSEAIPLSIGENQMETVPLKKKSLNNIPIPPPPRSKPPPPPCFKPPPPPTL